MLIYIIEGSGLGRLVRQIDCRLIWNVKSYIYIGARCLSVLSCGVGCPWRGNYSHTKQRSL